MVAVLLSYLDCSFVEMLGLLYGRQFPSIRTDGAAECPVLFELDGLRITARNDRAASDRRYNPEDLLSAEP